MGAYYLFPNAMVCRTSLQSRSPIRIDVGSLKNHKMNHWSGAYMKLHEGQDLQLKRSITNCNDLGQCVRAFANAREARRSSVSVMMAMS